MMACTLFISRPEFQMYHSCSVEQYILELTSSREVISLSLFRLSDDSHLLLPARICNHDGTRKRLWLTVGQRSALPKISLTDD